MAAAALRKAKRKTARKTARKSARATPALGLYNAKRNFGRTSEPKGARASGKGWSYVIQQHDATRMHYDFRLELDGVLLSWAVPKGPSLDPKDKRLAVQTEDHPVTYRHFEGNIPHGEYGGGPVIVWDRGTWTPDGDPQAAMKKGHLRFTLNGDKLQGGYSLVRTRGKVKAGPKSSWLLIKRDDEHVKTGRAAQIVTQRPESVVSGRTVKQVEAGKPAARLAAGGARKGRAAARPRGRVPALASLEPQLATLVERPPSGDDWIYEIKFDGYRMLAAVADGKVELRSRNGLDWTDTLPTIVAALGKLKIKSAVIDGELCYIDDRGLSVFQKLQNALPRGLGRPTDTQRLYFYVFDLLFQDGIDVRDEPLLDRKHRLRLTLGKRPPAALRYSDHLQSDGHTALLHACSSGLEGLIAKRADAGYRGGRGKDWLKLKCQKRQEFVIVGMIRATGTRQGFRSLVLGTRDGKALRYAGRVGTGFSQQSLKTLAALLAKRVVEHSALGEHPRLPGVVWVKPDLVCEVEYTEITAEGSLRHPSFQGLRLDKPARQVKLEKAVPVSRVEADDNAVGGVAISSPERIMDAASGTTKLQIARYHEAVAPWFMPYAGNRPLALVRCPQGDAQQCFFQKHRMRGVGPHVQSARVGSHEVIHVEDTTGVLELVQFNVIEFHGWGASMADPHRPDWLVIDLDPDSALGFGDVVDAALEIREALGAAGLKSWVKTTGGKGLHVCVPLEPANDWATVKSFSQALAQALAAQNPTRYVATMSKVKRKGKIFIDYLRNGEGATAVLPYSPRSRPGMTVAMPVAWKDIRHLDPRDFTIASVPQRLKRRRSDPWKGFLDQPQTLPV